VKRLVTAVFVVVAAGAIVLFVGRDRFLWNATGTDHSADAALAPRVDKVFAEWDRPDAPGCGLGISRNGVVVYERGYGLADVERKIAITPKSVFPVASISKQFTAMSILVLAERGQLSLGDEVRRYIPEWSDHEHRITIRHLLTHTGGLRDVFLLVELAAPPTDGLDPNEAILRLLARQRGLNFSPGAEFQYNNGGYNLLGSIVKRVSGQSLRAFAEANIFKPLGMTSTHFHDNPAVNVPNRVSSYSKESDGLKSICAECGGIVGNAGLFTTVRDLLLWEENLAETRVGDPAMVAEMQKPTALTDGATSPYGFGVAFEDHRGLRTIGHAGGDKGIATYVVRYPDQGLAIALLCNRDDVGSMVGQPTQRVAEVYLADVLRSNPSPGSAASKPPSVSLSVEQLSSKAGMYLDSSNQIWDAPVQMVVEEGKLVAIMGSGDKAELAPVDANRFVVPGTPIAVEFVPAAAGRPQELHVTGGGPKPQVLQRLRAFTPSAAELRMFEGDYTCPELDVTYTIVARDREIVMRRIGRKDEIFKPFFPDTFEGFNIIQFSRDARRTVNGFTYHSSGVRNLHFDRVIR
jgi:CubicO group peptidase (beta-lactamase class C family)